MFTYGSSCYGSSVLQTLHLSSIFYEEKNSRWMLLFVKQVLRIKGIEESLFYGHLLEILGKALCVLDDVSTLMAFVAPSVKTSLQYELFGLTVYVFRIEML